MEAWVSGKGPLGPIGCFGLWFGILVSRNVPHSVYICACVCLIPPSALEFTYAQLLRQRTKLTFPFPLGRDLLEPHVPVALDTGNPDPSIKKQHPDAPILASRSLTCFHSVFSSLLILPIQPPCPSPPPPAQHIAIPTTCSCRHQRLFALVGHVCCRKLGAGHNPILARYLPDGQRKDANTLSPPINHPDILLEVTEGPFLTPHSLTTCAIKSRYPSAVYGLHLDFPNYPSPRLQQQSLTTFYRHPTLPIFLPRKIQILDNESVFRGAFREELLCMMHFQILVLLSAEARLQREASRRGPRRLSLPCRPSC